MRKLFICLLGLCAIAATIRVDCAAAEMKSLSCNEMARITGRSGLNLQAREMLLDLAIDRICYKDDDGAGTAGQPGYLSIDGLRLKGTVTGHPGFALISSGLGFLILPDLDYTIHDLDMQIDSFRIDAIRVGTAPGSGASFGSIGIDNLTMHMEGNIRISTSHDR